MLSFAEFSTPKSSQCLLSVCSVQKSHVCAQISPCLYNKINRSDIILGTFYMGLGVCVFVSVEMGSRWWDGGD